MNNNNFDFLRFFFASVVVLGHIVDLSQDQMLAPFKPFLDTYSSVTGFFIISGFLIGKSYDTTRSTLNYFQKRTRRLLPAYLISVVMAALLLSLFSVVSFQNYFTDKKFYTYLLSNIIFLNFIQPCLPGVFIHNTQCAVNGALWTIKVEVLFYILVPFIHNIIKKVNKKYLLLIFIYVFSIVYKSSLSGTGNSLLTILSRQTPGFLSYFSCGLSIYYYFEFYVKYKNKLLLFAIPIFIIEYYYNLEILRPIAFTWIIFYFAYSFPKFNNFGKYGDFSYGIYIFHFTLIQIFVEKNYFKIYNPFAILITIILIVFVAGIFSWNFIEKPFIKKSKDFKSNIHKLVEPKRDL